MRFIAKVLALAAGTMLAPLVQAEDTWTLESAKSSFSHHKAEANSVSILHDGWQITFLAHDGKEIGAAIVMARKGVDDHEYDLEETLTRVAELVNMDSPEAMAFEDEREMALLIDQTVMDALAEDTNNAFDGSPLEVLAYMLDDGYFVLHSMRDNGYLHWKTAKKSGVDLLMPMAGQELNAIEVTGRQEMNDFASEVLAEKLGLGPNTVQPPSRQALCHQLRCHAVTYMNSRTDVIVARTGRRVAIGKRQAAAQLLAARRYAEISWPDEVSAWPEEVEEEEPEEAEEKIIEEEPPVEEPPLDPPAARKAYIDSLKAL